MPVHPNVVRANFATCREAVLAGLASKQSVCIIGDPGVGKSALLEGVATAIKRRIATLIGSTLDATDVGGIPFVNQKTGKLERHPIPEIRLAADEGIVLFLDELSGAPAVVQQGFMRVTFNRMAGDLPLHPDTQVVLATNPEEQAAGGVPISAPMMNRVLFMHLRPEADEVLEHLLTLGAAGSADPSLAALYEEARDFVDTAAVAPDLLQIDCPNEAVAGNMPWSSPRAVERMLRARAAAKSLNLGQAALHTITAAAVGNPQAVAYEAILEIRTKLPSVKEIAADPVKARIPVEPKMQIGAASLIPRVADINTHAAWCYTLRLTPEMAAACARLLLKRVDSPNTSPFYKEGMAARIKILAAIPKAA